MPECVMHLLRYHFFRKYIISQRRIQKEEAKRRFRNRMLNKQKADILVFPVDIAEQDVIWVNEMEDRLDTLASNLGHPPSVFYNLQAEDMIAGRTNSLVLVTYGMGPTSFWADVHPTNVSLFLDTNLDCDKQIKAVFHPSDESLVLDTKLDCDSHITAVLPQGLRITYCTYGTVLVADPRTKSARTDGVPTFWYSRAGPGTQRHTVNLRMS